MSETMKSLESKMASELLECVDIKNADEAMNLDRLLLNLDWEIHAVLSMIWAVNKAYAEELQARSPHMDTYEKIARLLEMAEEKTEHLRESISAAQCSIGESWLRPSGQDQRRNREGGVK